VHGAKGRLPFDMLRVKRLKANSEMTEYFITKTRKKEITKEEIGCPSTGFRRRRKLWRDKQDKKVKSKVERSKNLFFI
jgi:hypothetical protein